MTRRTHVSDAELPSIRVTIDDMRRLSGLATSSMDVFPRVAEFLAREMDRANVESEASSLRGVVRMGSRVSYRDDGTGGSREVVLVYPHEADISRGRISVLTPVGAALIGLSVGQSIEFQTPGNRARSLTVLEVASEDLSCSEANPVMPA